MTEWRIFSFSGMRFELPEAISRAFREEKRTFISIFQRKKRKIRAYFLPDTGMFFKKYASFLEKGRHNAKERSLCFPEEGVPFSGRGSKVVFFYTKRFLEDVPERTKSEYPFHTYTALNQSKMFERTPVNNQNKKGKNTFLSFSHSLSLREGVVRIRAGRCS